MYRRLSLIRDAEETWRWRGLGENGPDPGDGNGVDPGGAEAAGTFGGGTGDVEPDPAGGSPAGPIDTGRSSQTGTSPDVEAQGEPFSGSEIVAPGPLTRADIMDPRSWGFEPGFSPGFQSGPFSKAGSVFGALFGGLLGSALGYAVGGFIDGSKTGPGSVVDRGPSPAGAPSGGPEGDAGGPGGPDSRTSPYGWPPIFGDGGGGATENGDGVGPLFRAGQDVTIPWVYVAAGVGAILLLRSRSPKRR